MLLLAVIICIPTAYGYVNVSTEYKIYEYLPEDLESVKGMHLFENVTMEMMPDAQLIIVADNVTNIENFENGISSAFLENGRAVGLVVGPAGTYSFQDNRVTRVDTAEQLMPFLVGPDMRIIAIYCERMETEKIELEEINRETHLRAQSLKNVEEQFRGDVPRGAEIYLTGELILWDDLRQITDEDRGRIDIVAVTGIGIALISLLASFWVPVSLAIAIGLAIFWNLGLCFWWPGSISFIGFAAVAALQLGVTVDYGFYLSTRYREERKKKKKEQAMIKALSKTSRAIVGAAVTTIVAFGSLGIARLGIISEFGLIVARGIFLSFLAAMIVFPSILMVSEPLLLRLSRKGFRE